MNTVSLKNCVCTAGRTISTRYVLFLIVLYSCFAWWSPRARRPWFVVHVDAPHRHCGLPRSEEDWSGGGAVSCVGEVTRSSSNPAVTAGVSSRFGARALVCVYSTRVRTNLLLCWEARLSFVVPVVVPCHEDLLIASVGIGSADW